VSEKRYSESYLEAALEEILEIEFYLESQRKGLGDAFREEVNSTTELLLDFPESAPVVSKKGIRRRLLHRFSYAILYVLTGDSLLVIAVAHTSRAPNYWEDRLE
jgi:plasmid stabilization system protein ParE